MSLTCPNCRVGVMRKHDFHNQTVDYCEQCEGVWFDSGELDQALSIADNNDDNVTIEHHLGDQLGPSLHSCTRCKQSLIRYNLMNEFTVQIDTCPSCAGVWIDKAELDRVVLSPIIKDALEVLNKKVSVKSWFFQILSQMPVEYNVKPKRLPYATYALLVINIVLFMAYFIPSGLMHNVLDTFALRSDLILAGKQPWTLISHMFLHGGFMHLIGIIYFLYIIGDKSFIYLT